MISPVFEMGGKWCFEGEYHVERFDTEAQARAAADAYDEACRKRSEGAE